MAVLNITLPEDEREWSITDNLIVVAEGDYETTYRVRAKPARATLHRKPRGGAQLTLGAFDRAHVIITGPQPDLKRLYDWVTKP